MCLNSSLQNNLHMLHCICGSLTLVKPTDVK